MNPDDVALRRRKLSWAARRGLLELDVFIHPFINERLPSFSLDEIVALESLLAHEDPQLWQFFLSPHSAETRAALSPLAHRLLTEIVDKH